MTFSRTGNKDTAAVGSKSETPDREIFRTGCRRFLFIPATSERRLKVLKTPAKTGFFDFY
jgi:hypothetical protein